MNVAKVIYGDRDRTVREAVQPLLGLSNVELLDLSGVGATSGDVDGGAHVVGAGFGQVELLLIITDAATDGDDTLDVFVDSSPDDGVTWVNFVHFTQVLGNGANSLKFVAISPRIGTASEENVTTDLAAGATPRPFVGDRVRVRHNVVDPSGSNASFDFKVVAAFKP